MVEVSILKTVKANLGIVDGYTVFDSQLITYINGVFVELGDLGVGPSGGFSIDDDTTTWEDYVPNDKRINDIKTYIGLQVRMLFDPPQNAFAQTAMEKRAEEMKWRINVRQEATDYVDPGLNVSPWAIDGMDQPIQIQGGRSWWISFVYKKDDGTPIPVTDFRMEFRSGREERGSVLYTTEGSNPSIVVTEVTDEDGNQKIIATLPGSATANKPGTEAWFDAWATDTSNGERVQLMGPRFVNIRPNVSKL